MYYSVLIETKRNSDFDVRAIFKYDTYYEDIFENIVKPYLSEKVFEYEGYKMCEKDILKITIKKSKISIDKMFYIYKIFNFACSMLISIETSLESIFINSKFMLDVTDEIIKKVQGKIDSEKLIIKKEEEIMSKEEKLAKTNLQMKPIIVKKYKIFLSCPGDIDFIDEIDLALNYYNKTKGEENNIYIKLVHWSKDGRPQSGDKPQNLINKMLLNSCHACIALFNTRFGTPTDHYGSGTEEEISKMLENGNNVFMYFFDIPVKPSETGRSDYQEQFQKVREFKNKYKEKGLYWEYSDKNSFLQKFIEHIHDEIISWNEETNVKKN